MKYAKGFSKKDGRCEETKYECSLSLFGDKMEIQDIWDTILELSKDVFIPALLTDAKRLGFEETRASIEDSTILTLI